LEDISGLVKWIRHFAGDELTEHPRWDGFELAVVEAATNVFVHSLKDLPESELCVELFWDSTRLVVILRDRGRALPSGLLDDPTLPHPLATSGRGLWLIRQGTDEVSCATTADGNELRLTFRVSA
jgi:anti-sigma regulatory factor (Ser/Thr protein kinase)